mgnify:CR=1 FL=1
MTNKASIWALIVASWPRANAPRAAAWNFVRGSLSSGIFSRDVRSRFRCSSQRAAAPLMIPLGARVIDNSAMTAEETSTLIINEVREQFKSHKNAAGFTLGQCIRLYKEKNDQFGEGNWKAAPAQANARLKAANLPRRSVR